MTNKIIVHDPRGYAPKISGKRLAPRLEGLEGKKVYLVDCLFDNSDVFMDQLTEWFREKGAKSSGECGSGFVREHYIAWLSQSSRLHMETSTG